MENNNQENNVLVLAGKVTGTKTFSHEIYGEKFYTFNMSVPRLSGTDDIIPITISERLLVEQDVEDGKNIAIEGQFRSYNSYENEKNKLVLTVFAKEIQFKEEDFVPTKENVSNQVELIGYICKKPIYRKTPFGREISDILLAVNRAYNKSDYIPCIAWGRNARFCENLEVGTEIKIVGRVQSRQYEKKFEDGTSQTRTAYEVSVGSMELVEGNSKNENELVENNEVENNEEVAEVEENVNA